MAERIVQDCIERGGLRPGDRLPSITQLQRQFSVSRNTVWQALSMLGQKGVLENRQGSGCYVADPWHTRGVGRQNLIGFLASISIARS
jgi:DNA-binding GntR family transcriptional regulator